PGRTGKSWIPITTQGAGIPETFKGKGHHQGNVAACVDLIQAVEGDLQPEASLYDGRTTVEMIAAVFESHRLQSTVEMPLKTRVNPLTSL
ncbi:MAG: gfo/Idh/MocA family oxidoreductase, partial [Verrucomicrobiales bacterium]